MYKIIKITNNTNDKVYYQIDRQVPLLIYFTHWRMVKSYFYEIKETKNFIDLMSVLLWIRNDMSTIKFKESKSVEHTLSSLKDVEDAIDRLILQRRAERERIDAMSEEEYYNTNKTQQDESAN